jgi:predicted alpha/beta-fold hydrolase
MADWSNEKARTVREYLFRNASARLDYDRHVVRVLREINRRAEKVNTWIVGLSTGAIVLLVTGFSKLANIPRWQAVTVFAPFLFSIISGLLLRWLLKEAERSLQSRCWS